uniref:non-specific serine/threonine protein kinase n=1 Tax=Oryza barthii TaxID=65489 RepID=A0A0D3EL80_9ORYZ
MILNLIILFLGSHAASASNTLFPGQPLSGSETLVSENGIFELGFFSPSGTKHYLGIRYKNITSSNPVNFWLGNRIPITNFLNATLYIDAGELYIEELGSVLWTSNSMKNASDTAVAVTLNTGNFVVRDQLNSSMVVWQSFDHPADALLPGAWLGLDMVIGANILLTLYKPPYNCTLMIDQSRKRGFIMFIDGHDYLGTFPDWMVTYEENGSLVRLNDPEIPNEIEFMKLHLGQVSLLKWINNATSSGWQPVWSYPSSCKVSAFHCGAFGICTSTGTCKCIDGFSPTEPSEWELGHFVSGCSRITPSNCQGAVSTDSFVLLDNLQGFPDNPQNVTAATSEECQAACLSECFCAAYSYHSGCKIWHSMLLNLTLADNPPYTEIYMRIGSPNKSRLHILVFILIFGSIAVILVMLMLLLIYKKRSSCVASQAKMEGFLAVYSYAQVKKATRNFSDKLGEGSFGSVFKGTIAGSTIVAVKKLKGLGHTEKQFRTEVQTVGMIQHTNLVRLLGFCTGGTRRLLVYEYMPNGSLDSHLFSETSRVLSWNLRHRIVIGIARGLAYLHEECRDSIIHCDIKPENILLDAELCPKIADFEWISGQPITYKADVYSFGVLLFEIISGRRSTEKIQHGNHRYFPLYAAAKVNEGDVLCLLDDRLEGNASLKELDVACRVAFIQDDEIHRPSMRQVIHMLEGIVGVELPPIPASFQNLMDGYDSDLYSVELNAFSGALPPELARLRALQVLDLSFNGFNGTLPAALSNLTQLVALNLSNNSLSGRVPDLGLPALQFLNLSNNHLDGPVPTSLLRFNDTAFAGNNVTRPASASPAGTPPSGSPAAAGAPAKRRVRLSQAAILAIVVGGCIAVSAVIAVFLIAFCNRSGGGGDEEVSRVVSGKSGEKKVRESPESKAVIGKAGDGNRIVFFEGPALAFDLEDLLRASAEVLGKGAFGTAYRAVLEDATTVVVKRLKEVSAGRRDFEQQMELVGRIRHANVAELRAYYYSKDEKLLVYDFYSRGSVSNMLHGKRGEDRTPLNWETRVRIALGAARGIAHIHTENNGKFVHGNIKASNVFLNNQQYGCVSDLGLASLMNPITARSRSLGYCAPEVTDSRKASQCSDVYSFGVFILELLTGRSPVQITGGGNEVVHLVRWVQSVVREEWTAEVFDVELMRYPNIEEEMVEMLQIAMVCVSRTPERRPKMSDVVRMLEDVRRTDTGTRTSTEASTPVVDVQNKAESSSAAH